MTLKNVLEAKLWLCFFFLAVFSLSVKAQDPFLLKGRVVGEQGEMLIKANVWDKLNPASKTTSDLNGRFSLESIYSIDSLDIDIAGYLKKTVKAEYAGEMEIVLTPIVISDLLSISSPPPETQYYPPIINPEKKVEIQKMIALDVAVIQVREFMQNPLGSSVYPVAEIGKSELESTNNFSVQDALNQIPGVKMDSRGYNGSRRLSLRGTIARSPFGVRNVRMNVNGFPITSSDGSSALELIEPADIQSMTIYKGPSGSYEMTGTGGVISTKLKSVFNPISASAELTYGSAEFIRTHFSAGFSKKKLSARLSGVYSSNEGYRLQEANEKTQLTLTAKYKATRKLSYDILGMLYDGYWELPGHITLEALEEDPTQADPDSEDMNAHVARRRAYIGLHQKYIFMDRVWNDTWVFGHFSDKLNPYGTHPEFFQGLKDEVSNEFGGRTEFVHVGRGYKCTIKAGTQWQNFSTQIQEFNNLSGEKGTLKYDNSTMITEGLFFGSVDYKMNEKFTANVQLGYNFYGLDNTGINPNTNSSLDYRITKNIKLLPRGGIVYKFRPNFSTSLSYSEGVGFPSIFEWVDTGSGLFSSGLDAEFSQNVELVFKGKVDKGRRELDYSISGYRASVDKTITERENDQGNTFYENSGKSTQLGIEAQLSYLHEFKPGQSVNVYSTLTLNDYTLDNDTGSTSLYIAGIPPTVIGFGIRGEYKQLRLSVHGRSVSQITTELGDDFNEETDYLLLNTKASYQFNKAKKWRYTLEVGANNLLDQTYTSFYRLNATDRIYNPMAGRNFYTGIKINFN